MSMLRFFAIAALALAGCDGQSFDGAGGPPAGQRLITGAIRPPSASDLAQSTVALQVAAVSIDARETQPFTAFSVSPAFDPAANGGLPVAFRMALPVDRAFMLYLQVPSGGREGLGTLVARMRFAKDDTGALTDVLNGRALGVTTPLASLDLGTMKITAAAPSNAAGGLGENVVLLGEDESVNPLSLNDADGDGTPDLDDADDDDDLIPDAADDDANGDGLPDAVQGYDALRDRDDNGDRIPDPFQP